MLALDLGYQQVEISICLVVITTYTPWRCVQLNGVLYSLATLPSGIRRSLPTSWNGKTARADLNSGQKEGNEP